MLNLIADELLPPTSLAVLALLLVLAGRRRLATMVLVLLVLLGMPWVSATLANALAPPLGAPGPQPQAIVILSADGFRVRGPVDLGPGLLTLDRMRGGAELARQTGLPVLVSGGPILGQRTTLAEMMAISLKQDFGLAVRWQEDRSLDTWQNAEFSAAILRQAGITRIFLVTHVWHMRRSMAAFRHFGIDPVPAPVRPALAPPFTPLEFIPQASAWTASYYALHEWLGLAYYALRG